MGAWRTSVMGVVMAGPLLLWTVFTALPTAPVASVLRDRTWTVQHIAGADASGGSQLTLRFASDGSLLGHGGCNRIHGRFAAQGARLTLSGLGSSLMNCPPAIMAQERRLLSLLRGVRTYRIEDGPSLVLTGAAGDSLVAR